MPPTPELRTGPVALPGAVDPAAPLATLVVLPPPADLAGHVEYLWQLVLAAGAPPGACWRVVADGYVDLSVRTPLDAEPLRTVVETPWRLDARREAVEFLASRPAVVCNAATAARALPMDRPLLVTGARFRLGAVPAVLRTPALALVDGARPLDDVLDGHAAAAVWQARGCDAPRHVTGYGCGPRPGPDAAAAQHVIRAIARATAVAAVRRLVARIAARGPGGVDPRVQGALRLLDGATAPPYDAAVAASAGGAAPMAALCRELAVSRRTLERLFAEQVGLAPRTYARLRRVGGVAAALERGARGPAASLSALAHGLGYADHAHMTREFTRVMGVTPSRYRVEALAAPVVRRLEGGEVAHDRRTPVGTVGTAEPGEPVEPLDWAEPARRRRAA